MRLIVWAVLAGLVIYASASFGNASISPQVPLQIEFSSPVNLPIGTSVLLDGQRVGHVTENLPGSHSVTATLESSTMAVETLAAMIRPGAMAVVSSTWAKEAGQPISFIEVLNPEPKQGVALASLGASVNSIVGYKDFESFWRNKSVRHWTD